MKVGVSLKQRFTKRVFEQGADVATILTVAPNGKQARQLEHQITEEGIRDKVRKREKLKGLYKCSFDPLLKDFQKTVGNLSMRFNFDESHVIRKPHEEAHYPTLSRAPYVMKIRKGKVISGEILGVKGSWIIVKENGGIHAVNAWKLAGWVVKKSGKSMKAQTSLRSFSLHET